MSLTLVCHVTDKSETLTTRMTDEHLHSKFIHPVTSICDSREKKQEFTSLGAASPELNRSACSRGKRYDMRSRKQFLLGIAVALVAANLVAEPVAADRSSFRRPSGGSAVAHRDGTLMRSADQATSETYSIGRTAMEPTIGFAPGGDLFYAAGGWTETPGVATGGSTEVMRSEDGGQTWASVTPTVAGENPQKVSLDPYVYVDNIDGDNARVFTIDLTVACSYMSFSDDGGDSWITNPLACGRPINDHQTLFSGPPVTSTTIGYPHVVYYCWNDVVTSSCSKSLDGGLTFHPTGAPPFVLQCGGLHGHGRTSSDGTVYLPRQVCGVPTIAVSHDEGRSWKTIEVSDIAAEQSQDPSIAVDKKGHLYFLWIGAKDRLPYLSVSRDHGETWSKAISVAPPGLKEANLVTIDALGTGKVAIAYMGSANSPWPRCTEQGCSAGDYSKTTWTGHLTVSATALSKSPTFITGLASRSNEPLVSQTCGPGRCHNVMDFIDVEISPLGIAFAAFVDSCIPEPAPGCTADNPINASAEGSYEGIVTKLVGAQRLN